MVRQPDLLIRKLIEKLADTDPLTRRNAAGALRMHGLRAAEALPALSELLSDCDLRVRREAEMAVDQLASQIRAFRLRVSPASRAV
ncbi:MAG: HEAT repeat domain-containing protein [Planctomycetota bacterium]